MSGTRKRSGSFYTPQRLADYIVYRLFQEKNQNGEREYCFDAEGGIEVLEPSVGSGYFLDSLLDKNYFKNIATAPSLKQENIPHLNIDAVEIDHVAANNTGTKSMTYSGRYGRVKVENQDYLTYFLRHQDKKYDLIIGNPPYVRRRNMSAETRELCAEVHKAAGLKDMKPKNLWTSFLAAAKASLKEKGVVAFVLPTDLIMVKYAAEIREMMKSDFDRTEIFTLNWSAFSKYDDVEQDVVILICSKGHGVDNDRPRFYHIDSEEDLVKPKHTLDFNNSNRDRLGKWTNYLLSPEEFAFLDAIHQKVNPKPIRDFCDSGAGIVTAANDYFIVDEQTVNKYKLTRIARPMIKKSSSMVPAIILNSNDIDRRAAEGAELYFLEFPDKEKSQLPSELYHYAVLGETLNLHKRYKMLLRDNWYAVPSVWKSEGFFTKRSHIHPRIIVNEAGVYVTDAFYRIKMKKGYDISKLSFSYFNTLSFIYSELLGRYYVGGVLELTPNEFKNVEIPYSDAIKEEQVVRLDEMVRSGVALRDILDYTDKILFADYSISTEHILRLRAIYRKLLRRRMKKDITKI